MGGHLLGLSMFIMLLAFFIILNAISNYEQQKARPVLRSIEQAFSTQITDYEEERPSVAESPEKSSGEGDTLDRIKALFTAQIPSHKTVMNKKLGTMHISVPYDEFETAVLTMGQAPAAGQTGGEWGQDFFLPAMVALVRDAQAGVAYRMDITLNIDGNPARVQRDQPQRMSVDMKRLSALTEKIEQAGLPRHLISVGMAEGKAGTVDLYFRPHIPFNPLGNGHGR